MEKYNLVKLYNALGKILYSGSGAIVGFIAGGTAGAFLGGTSGLAISHFVGKLFVDPCFSRE